MLLASLLVLAFLEAAVALRYFMHLKYEVPLLFWTLIPGLLLAFVDDEPVLGRCCAAEHAALPDPLGTPMQPMAHMVGPMLVAMIVLAAPAGVIFVGLMLMSWRKRKGDDPT